MNLRVCVPQYQTQCFCLGDPLERSGRLCLGSSARWTADHVLICNPGKIDSEMSPHFVLVPMPGIDFDEKPLSRGSIMLELNFGNSCVSHRLKQSPNE